MSRLMPLLALLAGCQSVDEEEPSPLLGVETSASWTIPELQDEAWVVYTPMGVPYVYAANKADLGRVVGFTLARDRFFYMDVASRLSLGKVSELLGDQALETDIEQRGLAATWIADRALGLVEADPEMLAYFDGIAAGVNAWIDAVIAGDLPPPSEYARAAGLLGASDPTELLIPWDRRRVVGGLVTVLYETGFETKDVGRSADAQRLDTLFDGAPEQALREAGLLTDVWGRVEPVKAIASAPHWREDNPVPDPSTARPSRVPVHPDVLQRLRRHTERVEARLGHDWEHGFGSNAWAVAASASADGRAMVATDGHLPLSVPPLFYQIGVDTEHLGGGDVHQVGMMTPAMPLISTGTNGDLAFGQTQLIGDITDWYSEELVLDEATGAPLASRFRGGQEPLVAEQEAIEVGAALGSTPRTFTFTRYTTFDGRWITSIEGRAVGGPEDAGPGETAVNLLGDWVVPADVDDDGRITATSFDYAGLDLSAMATVIDRYAKAPTIAEFKTATEDLVAYSLNLVVADATGEIFYTGFQAVPCRGYLERGPDGVWTEGSDPNLLLDGTRYGGFTIPIVDGRVSYDDGGDPSRCVIPYERYPHSFTPDQGFLVSANNDPGGYTFDGSLTNEPDYIGGPWMEGYRADEITEELAAAVQAGGVSLDDMKRIQGDHTSVLGEQLTDVLLDAIDVGQAASEAATPNARQARLAALYDPNADRFDEVASRLEAWAARGYEAASGVETFYDDPTPDDVQDAVATMIFNVWMGRFVDAAVGDEGFPGLGFPTGDTGRFRILTRMLEGRGPGNPLGMGSYSNETQASIYFDDRRTPDVVESIDEIALIALADGLDYLTAEPTGAFTGGFGTDDMDAWLWGLRHLVTMNSLIGDFFGLDGPEFAPFTAPFNITPAVIPVDDDLQPGDPRFGLPGFPRPGDNLCVDAANSGTNGRTFTSSSGPVWRMVVALGGAGGFEAYNVLPGGQSGLIDSPHFADQARLWLANDYLPVPLEVADVAARAERREVFTP